MPSPHSANTATGSSLPPKENAQFKRILKCYEQKQYKNGLKFAKQILTNPKFAEHGETLAMKGLTLNCLGRKDEAYDYVRRGLRNDLKSHVCWHVYGLLQRSDKKYDEAIKCYRNALKWDKENIQILRDLSLLQIQMRDLEGYKETRYQLFQLRPTQRASWIGFAMSYHLLNDYDMTLKILEEFRKTQQKAAYDYEHSELLLYQNMVIQESGDISGALEHLMKYEPQICDQAHFLTTKGSLLLKLDRAGEAKAIFEELIQRNPENHESYKFLEQASGADTPAKKLAIYVKYRGFYPKAQAPQRLPLNYAEGQEFRDLVEPYLKKALRKGVPPLFVDLKPLYKNPDNCAILEEICTTYLKHMRANGTFDGKTREPPTALLWLLYYLSQHYDYKSDYATALQLIDEAIAHTPTLIELFLHKGKIYKHIDNREEAAYWMDEAQVMDRADRYINCKSAKYLLRANQVKEAEEMCKWFTRGGVPAMESLNEMQCMWFQTECAGAFERLGKYGEALKKCIEVDRHFTEIIEDQFDFHTYCMRKLTLRSYVDLLRLEDVLRSHPFYEKAAFCAIRVYLRLFDKPITDDDKLNEIDTENMDPSELKKLRNKQKKAKRKAELEAQEMQQLQARKELHNKSQKKNDDELDAPQKDELYPDKLERPEDPLGEALKFLEPLQLLAADRLSTHVLAFEIYFRKRKPLLMLQSIKRALNTPNIPPNDPQVHSCVIRLQKFVDENRQSFPAPVNQVLDRETQSIFADKSAVQRNRDFLSANDQSLNHVAVGAEMSVVLDGSEASQKAALKLIGELERFKTGVDIKTCSDIFHKLEEGVYGSVGVAGLDGFRQSCAQQFPLTILFNPELKKQSKTTTTTTTLPPSLTRRSSRVFTFSAFGLLSDLESRFKPGTVMPSAWTIVWTCLVWSAVVSGGGAQSVIELGDASFDTEMETFDTALVMFYAPWCGHCKRLKPEFDKAAEYLGQNDPPVHLVKVDCTEDGKEVCGRFEVKGYPTLKIFRGGEMSQDYNGPRELKGIVKYMQAQVGPASKHLKSQAEVDQFLARPEVVVVASLAEDSDDMATFLKTAESLREEVLFGHCTDDKLCGFKGIQLRRPAHLQTKLEASQLTFDGAVKKDQIKKWIKDNYHGLVGHRTLDNGKDFPKPLVVVYYDVDYVKNVKGTNYWRNRVMKVAKAHTGLNFAVSNKDDFMQEMNEFGLTGVGQTAPDATITTADGKKYVMSDTFSVDTFASFIQAYEAGSLEAYIKSEDLPDNEGKPVKVAVARNFDELVTKSEKDVLVEFYAPWCGHCKKLTPIYDELGTKMEGENVEIVKMDATANDVPSGFDVRGFPTLFWLPKSTKKAVAYQGGRELDDFVKFIAENASSELNQYDRKGKPKKAEL